MPAPNSAAAAQATAPIDPPGPGGHILTVGAGMEFADISQAIAAAHDNDVIAVEAGTYVDASNYADNNVINAANVTIEGVGGMAHLEMGSQGLANGKALLVAENGLTLKNFELSGATDGNLDGNLEGIRLEGGNLTVEDCYIHDNEEGILAPTGGTVTIEDSEFADNGAGDGFSHNIYVGPVAQLTVTNSYFHAAVVGHEIKSRAAVTVIENNVIADGATGTASYDIDLPNAGAATITGNIIEKGPDASNTAIIHYGGETQYSHPVNSLDITGNTIINDLGASAIGVLNQSSVNGLTVTANLSDNQIFGLDASQLNVGPLNASDNTTLTSEPTVPTSQPWANAPVIELASGPLTLTLTTPGHTVSGVSDPASLLTITDTYGGNTIDSGVGAGIDLVEQGSYAVISTSAGTSNTISVGDRNTVNSAGNDVIAVVGLYNYVTASGVSIITTGAQAWGYTTLNGDEALDVLGGGIVTVGASADAVVDTGTGGIVLNKAAGGTVAVSEATSAGAASVTLEGGAANVATTNSGIAVGETDAGSATIIFGGGSVSVTGGSGAETYVFTAGTGGNYVISDFKAGIDTLSFQGFANGTVQSTEVVSGNSLLTLDDGSQLELLGVTQPVYGPPQFATLTTSGNQVSGGAGLLTVMDSAGGNTITGGTGGLIATVEGYGTTIVTAPGATDRLTIASQDVVSSAGFDTILVTGIYNTVEATGAASLDLTSRSNTVTGGAGTLTVTDEFGANTINGGSGGVNAAVQGPYTVLTTQAGATDTATVAERSTVLSAGTDVINVSGSYSAITASGHSTINVAAGSFNDITLNGFETLNNAGGGIVAVGAEGDAVVCETQGYVQINKADGGEVVLQQDTDTGTAIATVSGGSAQILGSNGAYGGIRVITNAAGADTVLLGTGAASVASYGQDTVCGGAGSAAITASGVSTSTLDFLGGSGAATITAGAGMLSVTAGLGALGVQFGSGTADLQLGPGAPSILQFVAGLGGGDVVIDGFRVGTDQICFAGFGGDAVQTEQTSNGSTTLVLTDGTHILFAGLTQSLGV